MVIPYLKRFTFLSKEEIDKLEESVKTEPEKREAGKRLAFEVVKYLHGEGEAIKAKETSEKLFSGELLAENMPTVEISKESRNIMDILVASEIAPSKSEARRLITQGGITLDGQKVEDINMAVEKDSFVVAKGKKKIVKIEMK
jgi:tyrosyl-tRNA synthetase